MTGLWLVSYGVLWILVVGLCFLVLGLLQQIGLLQQQLEQPPSKLEGAPETSVITLENDGPRTGSDLPELVVETINGFGTLPLAPRCNKHGILLMFMSPMCESCQYVVEPLNKITDDGEYKGRIVVILKADMQTCRAFLSIFPLHLPVVCDSDRTISMSFNVHRNPFGLLYNSEDKLIRKDIVEEQEHLERLIGDVLASSRARPERVLPQISSDILA